MIKNYVKLVIISLVVAFLIGITTSSTTFISSTFSLNIVGVISVSVIMLLVLYNDLKHILAILTIKILINIVLDTPRIIKFVFQIITDYISSVSLNKLCVCRC